MRRTLPFALTLALSLVASTAAATVTEPNGLQVPVNGNNGEEELNTFFASRGENINWQADAQSTPNAFSPLCGFTATFVLNQAGGKFGLAWYNDTGVQPQAGDLHEIIPAGAALGQAINGATIKNDPAYAGGLVGFALESGQTHYTNPAYNPQYGPNLPWILALMYASTVTPNAYYICFEDGNVNGMSFANDGDFNDDVFFLTGITCDGGGQPCSTGLPGICGPGVTQCTANGVTCQQLSQPAAMETCNGLDDDCNGIVDDGAVCPAGNVCQMGTCVQSCSGGEFNCPPNLVCNATGYCVDPACNAVTCPSGQICVQGLCKGPCDGVVCPHAQVCRVGACVDPCAGVTCDASQVCDDGVCVAPCSCVPCTMGLSCYPSGLCGDPVCAGLPPCEAGTYCANGMCVDSCMGAVCPTGETCVTGACVPGSGTGGAGGSSSSGSVFVGAGGSNGSGGMSGAGGAGGSNGSGGHATGSGSGGSSVGSKSGCGCVLVGAGGDDDGDGSALAWVALGVLGIAATRRRR